MPGTVLVVEDEADLANLLTEVLESAGYDVVLTTGSRAAERAIAVAPVAVITDYMMPGLNGEEVVRDIRSKPSFAQLPVLLVTGLSNAHELATTIGANAYLRKPFDVDSFISIVHRMTGTSG